MTDLKECALACASMMTFHNGTDSCVLDFRKISMWTDFFVISTVTSNSHLGAMARHTEEFMAQYDLYPMHKPGLSDDDSWCLLDYGNIIVHIMTKSARDFYELEKLWFEAEISEVKTPAPL